jgi:two-component system, OmpR family, sensor histidine kinase KdpD
MPSARHCGAASILAGHCVVIDPPAGLPMLALDMVLFEQILFDFLDNAARQALDGTVITVAMHVGGETVVLRIMDESVDIPPAGVERSFEKFPRATEDRRRAGTGLAIGHDAAMGGTVTAANRAGRLWAATTITLPVPVRAPQPEQASVA